MSKLVKIIQSPFQPALEVVEDIVIKLHVPYSEKSVTVQVNPNLQEYIENADSKEMQVRQFTFSTTTEHTRVLSFDLVSNKKHKITIENNEYEIELFNIGKEDIEGQFLLYYEFNVSKY